MARPPAWRRVQELAQIQAPPVRRWFEVWIDGVLHRFETLKQARRAAQRRRAR